MDLFSRRCRATVLAVSRIDGLIGTQEREPDLLAPLGAYLFPPALGVGSFLRASLPRKPSWSTLVSW
jgi:hypothetical protein